MRLVYKNVNFDGPSMFRLAYAAGASSTRCEEGPVQEDLVAVRRLGSVAQIKPTC